METVEPGGRNPVSRSIQIFESRWSCTRSLFTHESLEVGTLLLSVCLRQLTSGPQRVYPFTLHFSFLFFLFRLLLFR